MFAVTGGWGGGFENKFRIQLSLSWGWQLHKAALFFCFHGFASLASLEKVPERDRSECGLRTPSQAHAELCKHL